MIKRIDVLLKIFQIMIITITRVDWAISCTGKYAPFAGEENARNWCEHRLDPVREIGHVTVLWDFTL